MNENQNNYPRMTQAELIMQMAQLNVEYENKIKELEKRQYLLEEKVDSLMKNDIAHGCKSTISSYVTRNGLPIYVKDLPQLGRQVASLCRKRGYSPSKVSIEKIGEVNTYPDVILYEFFNSYLKNKQYQLAVEVASGMRQNM